MYGKTLNVTVFIYDWKIEIEKWPRTLSRPDVYQMEAIFKAIFNNQTADQLFGKCESIPFYFVYIVQAISIVMVFAGRWIQR